MIVDRYYPINLFELIPKLKLELEPELAQLDRLLEDDFLFERVKGDLGGRYPNSARLGRPVGVGAGGDRDAGGAGGAASKTGQDARGCPFHAHRRKPRGTDQHC